MHAWNTQPGRVAVAGDWHGNTRWACFTLEKIAKALKGEDPKLVLHLGDFGIWPGKSGSVYLSMVNQFLDSLGMTLVFIDGNHEDHDQLDALRDDQKPSPGSPAVQVKRHIFWLPRGTRWAWHGREWLAMGGAASPDRATRVMRDWGWWPQEYITPAQIHSAMESGTADVLVSHDAPSGVFIPYPPPMKDWLQEDLDRAQAGRELLQQLTDSAEPGHIIHGHHHRAYQKTVTMAHGDVEVTGLNMDGCDFNWLILNTATMEWEVPDDTRSSA